VDEAAGEMEGREINEEEGEVGDTGMFASSPSFSSAAAAAAAASGGSTGTS